MSKLSKVLVTGGAGFVGARLVPKLADRGYGVVVFDLCAFGKTPFSEVNSRSAIELVRGDIRSRSRVRSVIEEENVDAVIHLAAISNDPCSHLEPRLTRDINRDGFQTVVKEAYRANVSRFIYASSASVYGIKEEKEVVESLPLEPLTLYAKYKAEGEKYLNEFTDDEFCGVSVRAATVCGYSTRLRLDLVVNLLTAHALSKGHIRVFGGEQMRPHIHIEDLTDAYIDLLERPKSLINGEAFNIVQENRSVMDLANLIKQTLSKEVPVEVEESYDDRSYRLSDQKMKQTLGFEPTRTVKQAIEELERAYQEGKFDSFDNPKHHNVDWMQRHPEPWMFNERDYNLS